ncbi:MAG: hypothetical protein FWG04_04695 [Desulfovibrionaceae bacterium]|nr:hypothetical protein [Desulfovibrionaceae bacterium]
MRNSALCLALAFLLSLPVLAANTPAACAPGMNPLPGSRVLVDIPMPPEPISAICWEDEAAFMVSLLDGWQNAPEAAERLGVCFMGILSGTNFDDSPAILYPRIFPRPLDQTPAQAADKAAQSVYRKLSRLPGGENMAVRPGKSFISPQDLPVEIRYFDNGPYPNVFEAAAYVTYHTASLGLILSATTRENRDAFLPVLLQVAREVYSMQVRDKRNHDSSATPPNTSYPQP